MKTEKNRNAVERIAAHKKQMLALPPAESKADNVDADQKVTSYEPKGYTIIKFAIFLVLLYTIIFLSP